MKFIFTALYGKCEILSNNYKGVSLRSVEDPKIEFMVSHLYFKTLQSNQFNLTNITLRK